MWVPPPWLIIGHIWSQAWLFSLVENALKEVLLLLLLAAALAFVTTVVMMMTVVMVGVACGHTLKASGLNRSISLPLMKKPANLHKATAF